MTQNKPLDDSGDFTSEYVRIMRDAATDDRLAAKRLLQFVQLDPRCPTEDFLRAALMRAVTALEHSAAEYDNRAESMSAEMDGEA